MNLKWLAFAFLFCSACSHKQPAPQPPSFPVRLTQVEQKDMPIYLEALGHVDPIVSIEIKSRIEGELTGVYFRQGQEVKQGDLLFTIDPRLYEAALREAKGTLEEQIAKLAISQEKVKRYQLLARDEYYSQIDYESLQADLAANRGLVDQSQGAVDRATIDLNYCKIYAPIDGLLGILRVDYGNLVADDGSQSLVTLNQMAPIFVTFSIPEVQLPLIQKNRSSTPLKTLAAYEDFHGEVFEGKLEILDNQVDPGTGMIRLRSTFSNDKRQLWPGQFIRTRLILTTQQNALVIPYTAIQLTLNGPTVFVASDDMTVEQRPVKLGMRQEDEVIVLEGLHPGETVVLEGQLNLSSGAKIYVPKALQ